MSRQIANHSININGVGIFYREAGDRENPSVLLLHGYPSSSVMFKNLMIALSDRFYLVAPDYPGFGFSGFPAPGYFEYTFGNISTCINAVYRCDRFEDLYHLPARLRLPHWASTVFGAS